MTTAPVAACMDTLDAGPPRRQENAMNELRIAALECLTQKGPMSAAEFTEHGFYNAKALYWLIRNDFARDTAESNLHAWDGKFKVTEAGLTWYAQYKQDADEDGK
jgi:hypothetical protein